MREELRDAAPQPHVAAAIASLTSCAFDTLHQFVDRICWRNHLRREGRIANTSRRVTSRGGATLVTSEGLHAQHRTGTNSEVAGSSPAATLSCLSRRQIYEFHEFRGCDGESICAIDNGRGLPDVARASHDVRL